MLENVLLSTNSVAYEPNKNKFLSSTKSYFISVYNLLILETESMWTKWFEFKKKKKQTPKD